MKRFIAMLLLATSVLLICATAFAALATGRCGNRSHIIMDGGELDIEWKRCEETLYMTGPAEFVFDGEVEMPI